MLTDTNGNSLSGGTVFLIFLCVIGLLLAVSIFIG